MSNTKSSVKSVEPKVRVCVRYVREDYVTLTRSEILEWIENDDFSDDELKKVNKVIDKALATKEKQLVLETPKLKSMYFFSYPNDDNRVTLRLSDWLRDKITPKKKTN